MVSLGAPRSRRRDRRGRLPRRRAGGRRRVRGQPRLRRARSRTRRRTRSATRRRGRSRSGSALGNEDVAIVQVMGEFELDVLAAALAGARGAEDRAAAPRHAGAHPPRRAAARDDLRVADRRVGARASSRSSTPEKAQRKLAQDILSFCRLGPKDPPGHKGWTQHLATLRRRATRLTKLDLQRGARARPRHRPAR